MRQRVLSGVCSLGVALSVAGCGHDAVLPSAPAAATVIPVTASPSPAALAPAPPAGWTVTGPIETSPGCVDGTRPQHWTLDVRNAHEGFKVRITAFSDTTPGCAPTTALNAGSVITISGTQVYDPQGSGTLVYGTPIVPPGCRLQMDVRFLFNGGAVETHDQLLDGGPGDGSGCRPSAAGVPPPPLPPPPPEPVPSLPPSCVVRPVTLSNLAVLLTPRDVEVHPVATFSGGPVTVHWGDGSPVQPVTSGQPMIHDFARPLNSVGPDRVSFLVQYVECAGGVAAAFLVTVPQQGGGQ